MRRPVDAPYSVTTNFGDVDSNALYGLHSGYDYAKSSGSPVYATTDGIIISNLNHPTRGQMVTLYDGKYYHRFMHNTVFKRNEGDKVMEGELIALSGGGANDFGHGLSTGPHVHWDMNTRGVDTNGWSDFVDPDDWLKGRIPAAAKAPDPVPAPSTVATDQRVVHPGDSAYYRSAPNTDGLVIDEFAANDIANFKGWVYGESIGGNNIWFVGKFTGGYSWSGAYTNTSTDGLADLNVATPAPGTVVTPTPVVTPPVVTDPTPVQYTFDKDVICVTEVIPAATTNFQAGNFPAKPTKIVMHDFGTKNVDTIGSVLNHFQGKNVEVSAHFVVSEKRIIQMVSLHDRAWHAGPTGNDFIGIEIDPVMSQNTIISVRVLLMQLEVKYGYRFELIKHSSLMPTLCGDDVNLADFDIHGATEGNTDTRLTALEGDNKKVVDFLGKTFMDFK